MPAYTTNNQEPGLIQILRWNLQDIGVIPQALSISEIDPMLGEVRAALVLVVFEADHGIKNILKQGVLQVRNITGPAPHRVPRT